MREGGRGKIVFRMTEEHRRMLVLLETFRMKTPDEDITSIDLSHQCFKRLFIYCDTPSLVLVSLLGFSNFKFSIEGLHPSYTPSQPSPPPPPPPPSAARFLWPFSSGPRT